MNNQHRPTQGIYLSLVDHDRLYESMSDRVVLINRFNVRDPEELERLNSYLYVEYESDALDTTPTCDCGYLRGEYNAGSRCPECGTVVVSSTERPIESILWMHVPEGVEGFIVPQVWTILSNLFNESRLDTMRYLTDSHYPINYDALPNDSKRIVDAFKAIGWQRGLNEFIRRFDEAMEVLFSMKRIAGVPRREAAAQFIDENKHLFFPKYLPILNRLAFIVEKTPVGTYADEVMSSALDAVRTLTSVYSSFTEATDKIKENRTIKVVRELAQYYQRYTKDNLGTKPGIFRRQVFGSRLDFSARAVISSLSHPHRYDELHLPWSLAVTMLKSHLTNKLLRHGMSPSEAEAFLIQNTNRYNPFLESLLNELIQESPDHALNVLFQRNPSLLRGSAQQLRVIKIKTDPRDNTIGLSLLVLAGFNADKVV